MNAKEFEAYKEAVEHNLRELSFVSTGACPGCLECGLLADCSEHERELAEEPHFSWGACESCGSQLGGNRYPAHGRDKGNEIVHFEICENCLYYLNYGQLDDQAMQEISAS